MTSKRHDPRFDDGTPARRDFRDLESRRTQDHKTTQLCTQVHRALELAFLGSVADPDLQDLHVHAVSPAPDASRMRVELIPPTNLPIDDLDDLLARVESCRRLLTDEVIQAIRRRKAPELVFVMMLTA